MLAFALFAIPSFRNGNIAAMIVSLGEFGIILSLPIWLQFVLGYDALQTGLILVALALGSFVASGFAAAFGNKVAPVNIVRVGLLAEIAGVIGIGAVVSPTASWGPLVPFLFLYGFGVGLATAQLTGVVLKDVPIAQSGAGSGTQSTARQVGSALGIAILGTVLFTTAGAQLDAKLADRGVPEAQRSEITNAVVDSAGAAIIGLEANPATAAAATDAKAAFSEGTRYAAFAAAGFLAIGFLATLSPGSGQMTPPARRPEDEALPTDAAAPGPLPAPRPYGTPRGPRTPRVRSWRAKPQVSPAKNTHEDVVCARNFEVSHTTAKLAGQRAREPRAAAAREPKGLPTCPRIGAAGSGVRASAHLGGLRGSRRPPHAHEDVVGARMPEVSRTTAKLAR